ncbi:MAG: acetolactate synthase small subunit [Desulfuromonadales bacterium]|nr:acetolactate synthase small subunit [Desulfuromonadales bacterium]
MTVKKMKRRAILAFVQNKPGTLNKISMMIRRKMYNVDTLTVCKAKPPGVSRMTITLREDDEAKVTQVIRQLEKFTEVIRAKELDRDCSYWREVAIVKFELDTKKLEKLQKKYQIEILDSKPHDIHIIQIAGPTDRLDSFLDDLGAEHLIEIARTGVTAMDK